MCSCPCSQCLFFQASQEEVSKGWGALGAHGYSFGLHEEVVVKSEGVVSDDNLQQISGKVLGGIPCEVVKLVVCAVGPSRFRWPEEWRGRATRHPGRPE